MKLTKWFDGEIKPELVGVYQTDSWKSAQCYQMWDGEKWNQARLSPVMAGLQKEASLFTKPKWRGLTKNPNKKEQ